MRYREKELQEMAEPISKTEHDQCVHAIEMVKDALIEAGYKLNKNLSNFSTENESYSYYYELKDTFLGKLTILLQGSYANNTNIRRYSDVDVSVVYNPIMLLNFKNYKNSIMKSLMNKFGSDVVRKNKSLQVQGNSNRKTIDVVPAFQKTQNIKDGIYFITDDNNTIYNYPCNQIDNENEKNKNTKYNYKKYVRIFKNLRYEMEQYKYPCASNIGSFQVESLLWNIPDSIFKEYSYYLGYGVNEIIKYLKYNIEYIKYYKESNGIKMLCSSTEEKNNMEGFINELSIFFNYERDN